MVASMIYCQRCKAANPFGQETCSHCGARFLITTSSKGIGPSASLLPQSLEEHLLERISALEYVLMRTNEQFERILELIQHQATGAIYDRAMLDTIASILADKGVIKSQDLDAQWKKRIEKRIEELSERERFLECKQSVLSSFQGEKFDDFARLVEQGADLILRNEHRKGVRLLEKALLLDPGNFKLSSYLGEYFFKHSKLALAKDYLKQALSHDPGNYPAMLMVGIISGEEGEIEEAKNYLTAAIDIRDDSFAAHYGLGRLLACEGRLQEAIPHLKRALMLKPTPEMHFLVGRAYFEQGRVESALRHLRKAVEMDPQLDAAFYHLGLIYLKRNLVGKARENFRAACEINPQEARYRTALRARAGQELPALPVFSHLRASRKKAITGGKARLIDLLQDDLNAAQLQEPEARKDHKR